MPELIEEAKYPQVGRHYKSKDYGRGVYLGTGIHTTDFARRRFGYDSGNEESLYFLFESGEIISWSTPMGILPKWLTLVRQGDAS